MGDIVPMLVHLLEYFKKERRPGECFGDWCHRLGAEKLLTLLPALEKPANRIAAEHKEEAPVAARRVNGDAHHPTASSLGTEARPEGVPALAQPETRQIPLTLPQPKV